MGIFGQHPAPAALLVMALTVGLVSANPLDIRAVEDEPQSHPEEHASCDKYTCASIVSYCMVEGSCSCNPSTNCSCCADCALCLGDKFGFCYDCVGMRRNTSYTVEQPTITSTVAHLSDPVPMLFQLNIQRKSPTLRYTVLRFPIVEELAAHHGSHHRGHHRHRHRQRPVLANEVGLHEETVRKPSRGDFTSQQYWNDVEVVLRRTYDLDLSPESTAVCSVIYFDDCYKFQQCQLSCNGIGASSFRWFHTGCCECAGGSCPDFGNKYPNCTRC